MTTERLFIALPLSEAQRHLLERQQQLLQQLASFQKWTHPLDLHITLKFLGETPIDKLDTICQLLQQLTPAHPSFRLRLQELGTFGSPVAPTILWAGIHGELPALEALQQSIESALEPLGFVREQRHYHPHITLARRYSGKRVFVPAVLAQHCLLEPSDDAEWSFDAVALYRTHLGRRPSYEQAAFFRLGK